MASLPEVTIPEEPPYDPEKEGNDEAYEKKPRVDTGKIFKSKQSNEQKLSKMRKKPKILYDNPMVSAEVSLPPAEKQTEPEPEPEVRMVIEEQEEVEPEPLPVTETPSPSPTPEPIKKAKRKMTQKQ